MAEEEATVPEIDAALVNDLLNIVLVTKDIPTLSAVKEVAQMHLHQINTELEHALRPPPEPEAAEEEAA